jgi:hypothetical protein
MAHLLLRARAAPLLRADADPRTCCSGNSLHLALAVPRTRTLTHSLTHSLLRALAPPRNKVGVLRASHKIFLSLTGEFE